VIEELTNRRPRSHDGRSIVAPVMAENAGEADRGEGTLLVLLHGTLMDHRMFEPQYEGLSDSMRVLAYDLRARTEAGRGPYDLHDLADDCRDRLDRLGVERAVVGGMSMGAFVALRFALAYPERTAGLVLIGCQATALSAEDRETWSRHYASRRGEAVGEEFARGEVELNFGAPALSAQPELGTTWLARFAAADGDAMHFEAESWIGMDDVSGRLTDIPVPSAVIHGVEDAAVPLAEAELMAERLPLGTLTAIAATGHAANLESPDQANEAIRAVVAAAEAAGSD
jgi:pimeloyl-ACP methyl ester carboxylesterase